MMLNTLLRKLVGFEPNEFPFISVYINAEVAGGRREAYPIWLKTQLSEEAQKYKDDPDLALRFEQAGERIYQFIDDELDTAAAGIAIFVGTGGPEFFETVELTVPFDENLLFSQDRPYVFPLVRLLAQNPSYSVLWADSTHADIYVFGGEARIRADIEADEHLETVKGRSINRTRVGGWSQGRYQRRMDKFQLQHAKETVSELEQVMKERGIKHLVLSGDEAAIMPVLRPQLTQALEEKVVGTIQITRPDDIDEIREKAAGALAAFKAEKDEELIEKVVTAAKSSAGLGSLGFEDTLRALSNGQVQELVLAANPDEIRFRRKAAERVLEEYAPGDDNSPVDEETLPEHREEMIDQLIVRAINSDAGITFVDAGSIIDTMGGVGAILRYNLAATGTG